MAKRIKKLTDEQKKELVGYKNANECSKSEAMRILAILFLNGGFDSAAIEQATEYDRKYASELRRKYASRGIDCLKDRKGKTPNSLLTKKQIEEILTMLKTQSPKDFGYETDFWTTSILAPVIKQKYNVVYKTKNPIYLLFKKAQFTFHKPETQYKNRSQEKIDEWKLNQQIVVEAAINSEDIVVLCGDEMMLTTQTTTQKVWLEKGKVPKVDVASSRKLRCIYGFLDLKTGKEYAFKTLGANSEETCKVLDKIGEIFKGKKIMIVWDNASWHKSALVREFLGKTKYSFRLVAFPPYAPELNPQERVWKAGRVQVTHNQFIANIDTTTDDFVNYLNENIFNYRFGN